VLKKKVTKKDECGGKRRQDLNVHGPGGAEGKKQGHR